jgi:hypothetical protein
MSDAFTTYWSRSMLEALRRLGQEGAPLRVLFGGPHTSLPSFRRAGVRPGDLVYPVRAYQGALYLLGCLRVATTMSLETYIAEHPELFAGLNGGWPMATLENYLARRPELAWLAPTCVDEVVLGEGTPIRLDVRVPPGVVDRLRYCSRRGERPLKHVDDGRITHVISLQGVYRLAPESAAALERLLDISGHTEVGA